MATSSSQEVMVSNMRLSLTKRVQLLLARAPSDPWPFFS